MNNLFSRVFSKTSAEENVATEVIAWFLEVCEPFRRQFLEAFGAEVGAEGTWEVITQLRLDGDEHSAWAGKRPDLVLQRQEPPALILVEIKIDAGVTWNEDKQGEQVPQTCSYRSYLGQWSKVHPGGVGLLATLTRWHPGALLEGRPDAELRFRQIVDWLNTASKALKSTDPAVSLLARQWADFIVERRWSMPKLEKKHIDAIKQIVELESWMWDLSETATREAAERPEWEMAESGKATKLRWTEDCYLLGHSLHLAGTKDATVQLGFTYGANPDGPYLNPAVYVEGLAPDEGWMGGHPEWFTGKDWSGKYVCLGELGSLVANDKSAEELTAIVRDRYREILEHLAQKRGNPGPE